MPSRWGKHAQWRTGTFSPLCFDFCVTLVLNVHWEALGYVFTFLCSAAAQNQVSGKLVITRLMSLAHCG